MKRIKTISMFFAVISCIWMPLFGQDGYNAKIKNGVHEIQIDGKSVGKTFEGFGALSAGASSRLLYDYPEPYRSDILDYLFKPNFGANLHHLKVEIGGDINSTDGSEPSHAITRFEFNNPIPGYFNRGYEWWLMVEAKKRNPDIILEGLQWGAPGWIGNGQFFSKDNAELVAAWIKGMKRYHNLDIDYVGICNERIYDVPYIKLLRKVLDSNGLQNVKIDAGDLWEPENKWKIADDIIGDKELGDAVAVINAHTTELLNHFVTANTRLANKPIWNGEAHPYGGDWYAASNWARYNRAYNHGGITKIIAWSLITSYHDFLWVPNSGIMKANTPWSGCYEVQPPIWVIAHTNQFARPGWKYLNSGCKSFSMEGNINEGFSVATLKSPDNSNYTIIIETMDAKLPQTLSFKISDELSKKDLSLWRSVFNQEEFMRLEDIAVKDGQFSISVFPNAIYSITTTTGQKKGVASTNIPKPKDFPFPYSDGFEKNELHSPGTFFSDQHGTFEVVERTDKRGNCLKQVAIEQGICWRNDYQFPQTIIGDINWKDYQISVDFMLPDSGSVQICGRTNKFTGNSQPFTAYIFEIQYDGAWSVKVGNKILASGKYKSIQGKWHSAFLIMIGDDITAKIDKKILANVKDSSIKNGCVALGTGWNLAYFDNLVIK